MNNQSRLSNDSPPLFSFQNFIRAVIKRKLLIAIFFVTVVGIVTVISLLTPHIYQASAKLLIEKEIDAEKAMLFRLNPLIAARDYNWINAEIAILKSYPVAERVVKNLGLNNSEQTDTVNAADILQGTIEKFQEKLAINNAKESNILVINYDSEKQKEAIKIVDETIRVYIDYRSELYKEIEEYEFFVKQMRIADSNLRELERKEANYKTQTEMISPESQRLILTNRLSDLDRRLTVLKTSRINKETKLAVIQKQMGKEGAISIPSTETSDSPNRVNNISRLKAEILSLEIEREKLLEEYTAQYSEVKIVESQILTTKKMLAEEVKQIVDEEKSSIDAIKAEEMTLEDLIADTRREISELAQKEYELSQISRGIEDSREIYSLLLKQREEARISLAKVQEDVKIKVISPAISSLNPVKPNKRMNVALAALFGLIGGMMLAFLLDVFDRPVRGPDDLAGSGINVLGSVGEHNS